MAESNGFEIVSVVPQLKAGGAFATEVYRMLAEPAVVGNHIGQCGARHR